MKISVIGVGRVGVTVAHTLVTKELSSELVLVDAQPELAAAQAADLQHAASLTDTLTDIRAGGVDATAGSDVLVLCASVPVANPRTRLDWAPPCRRLYEQIVPPLAQASPRAVVVVVTNPVDVMTWHAIRTSGFAPHRVVGAGTLVDSARFRALLSKEFNIHPDDIRAYILGEHGDTQFPALSLALTGGERLDKSPRVRELFAEAVQSGHEVFRRKGYTNYAIAEAVGMIVDCIVRNRRRTVPLSTLIDGYLGVRDVCLSMPVVLGREGVLRQLQPALNEQEVESFRRCAEVVREAIAYSMTDPPAG